MERAFKIELVIGIGKIGGAQQDLFALARSLAGSQSSSTRSRRAFREAEDTADGGEWVIDKSLATMTWHLPLGIWIHGIFPVSGIFGRVKERKERLLKLKKGSGEKETRKQSKSHRNSITALTLRQEARKRATSGLHHHLHLPRKLTSLGGRIGGTQINLVDT